MTDGDTEYDADVQRRRVARIGPLFTGSPRSQHAGRAASGVLAPPLRIRAHKLFQAGSPSDAIGSDTPLWSHLPGVAIALELPAEMADSVALLDSPVADDAIADEALVGAPYESLFDSDEQVAPADAGVEDWRDDSPSSSLGEAEPEDELLVLNAEADDFRPTEETPQASVVTAGSIGSLDNMRIEEIAGRLEAIARALRERGPAGPIASQQRDPLGALITGYLVGYFEGSESRGSIGSG